MKVFKRDFNFAEVEIKVFPFLWPITFLKGPSKFQKALSKLKFVTYVFENMQA